MQVNYEQVKNTIGRFSNDSVSDSTYNVNYGAEYESIPEIFY